MKQPRSTGGLRPLTPAITGDGYIAPPLTRAELSELYGTIASLKTALRAEQRRHEKLENALARYQSVLEKQLETQRVALDELRKALLTNMSQNLVTSIREGR